MSRDKPKRTQEEHVRSTRTGGPFVGTVKWFNDEKGYGFIVGDHDEKDVFVHHSVIQMKGHRRLDENQRVQYYVEASKTDDRLAAADVTVI